MNACHLIFLAMIFDPAWGKHKVNQSNQPIEILFFEKQLFFSSEIFGLLSTWCGGQGLGHSFNDGAVKTEGQIWYSDRQISVVGSQ